MKHAGYAGITCFLQLGTDFIAVRTDLLQGSTHKLQGVIGMAAKGIGVAMIRGFKAARVFQQRLLL